MNILKQFQEQNPDQEYRIIEYGSNGLYTLNVYDAIQVRLTWGPFWLWKTVACVNEDYIPIEEFTYLQ